MVRQKTESRAIPNGVQRFFFAAVCRARDAERNLLSARMLKKKQIARAKDALGTAVSGGFLKLHRPCTRSLRSRVNN
jgi:hypothetical protein